MLKLPPQNLEAEESILGALMIDKDAIFKIADVLHPQDFYKPAHVKICEVIFGHENCFTFFSASFCNLVF